MYIYTYITMFTRSIRCRSAHVHIYLGVRERERERERERGDEENKSNTGGGEIPHTKKKLNQENKYINFYFIFFFIFIPTPIPPFFFSFYIIFLVASLIWMVIWGGGGNGKKTPKWNYWPQLLFSHPFTFFCITYLVKTGKLKGGGISVGLNELSWMQEGGWEREWEIDR